MNHKDVQPPILLILSGPSGVGKDAVLSRMRDLEEPYHFTVTTTTRTKRNGETDGKDYIFVSQAEFRAQMEQDGFLEWAEVYGNYYGVPRNQVKTALKKGKDVIVKIDVQGAKTIKSLAPNALYIFLAPPSMDQLEKRLKERMTESPDSLKIRFETAAEEMKSAGWFDHVVINHENQLDLAVAEIQNVVKIARLKQMETPNFEII
ncbi:MAG: guanylate kinase [SAR202 cluster bacterium]|nr:guanylate kinase [SAR202 cluster bacterium]HJO60170.1 guanylate kinase [SAR202 cluster bacterium]